MATRTALATAPTLGRSSAGRAPIPRSTPVRRPFLPRTSSSRASRVATSGAAAMAARASTWSASRSRVRSASSTAPRESRSRRPMRSGQRARPSERYIVDPRPRCSRVGATRSWRDRRCARTWRRRGSRGRPGSCDRSGCPPSSGRGCNCPYVTSCWRAAALIRMTQSWRIWRLRCLPVTRRIGERVQERFARRLDELRLGAFATLGRIQQTLVALVGGDAALDSCHG